jgi:DNA-binding CsgD family transcriptional regulator
MILDAYIAKLAGQASCVAQRSEGIAFLRVAKDLYRLRSVLYICTNIPVVSDRKCYTHCVYSDASVRQFVSPTLIKIDANIAGGLNLQETEPFSPETNLKSLILPLRERFGESALFGITADFESSDWEQQQATIARECRILANYFHGHVLRINGHASENDIVLSARELDCLKWTAAGKTAWEASIILGISERTVRFHLDGAREKLNCATTTQAVAKAIINQLIDV